MHSARHFCPTLTKFGVPRHIFTEVASVEFHGNSVSGSHAAICEETDSEADGYDEGERRFSTACERA
jgi:hypothetical protein